MKKKILHKKSSNLLKKTLLLATILFVFIIGVLTFSGYKYGVGPFAALVAQRISINAIMSDSPEVNAIRAAQQTAAALKNNTTMTTQQKADVINNAASQAVKQTIQVVSKQTGTSVDKLVEDITGNTVPSNTSVSNAISAAQTKVTTSQVVAQAVNQAIGNSSGVSTPIVDSVIVKACKDGGNYWFNPPAGSSGTAHCIHATDQQDCGNIGIWQNGKCYFPGDIIDPKSNTVVCDFQSSVSKYRYPYQSNRCPESYKSTDVSTPRDANTCAGVGWWNTANSKCYLPGDSIDATGNTKVCSGKTMSDKTGLVYKPKYGYIYLDVSCPETMATIADNQAAAKACADKGLTFDTTTLSCGSHTVEFTNRTDECKPLAYDPITKTCISTFKCDKGTSKVSPDGTSFTICDDSGKAMMKFCPKGKTFDQFGQCIIILSPSEKNAKTDCLANKDKWDDLTRTCTSIPALVAPVEGTAECRGDDVYTYHKSSGWTGNGRCNQGWCKNGMCVQPVNEVAKKDCLANHDNWNDSNNTCTTTIKASDTQCNALKSCGAGQVCSNPLGGICQEKQKATTGSIVTSPVDCISGKAHQISGAGKWVCDNPAPITDITEVNAPIPQNESGVVNTTVMNNKDCKYYGAQLINGKWLCPNDSGVVVPPQTNNVVSNAPIQNSTQMVNHVNGRVGESVASPDLCTLNGAKQDHSTGRYICPDLNGSIPQSSSNIPGATTNPIQQFICGAIGVAGVKGVSFCDGITLSSTTFSNFLMSLTGSSQ
jgi:hypothetical protein